MLTNTNLENSPIPEVACLAYRLDGIYFRTVSHGLCLYRQESNRNLSMHYGYHNYHYYGGPIDWEGRAGSPLLWFAVQMAFPRDVVQN